MAERVSACSRVVVFDTICQYRAEQLPGFRLIYQPGELIEIMRAAGPSGDFRVRYMPINNPPAHFDAVARLAAARQELVLAVDEVDYFCSAGAANERLDWLVRYGRHRRVAMIYTARRPAEVWRNLTAQTGEFSIFRLTEPRDVDYLRRYIGQDADILPSLGQYQYLRYRDSGEVDVLGGPR